VCLTRRYGEGSRRFRRRRSRFDLRTLRHLRLPCVARPELRYSARSTTTGSTRVARRAGSQLASTATAASSSGMARNASGIVHAHAVQHPRQRTRHARARAPRRAPPGRREPRALPHDHAQHVAATGAERHADADLAGALRDGVRHHAVHADGREQHGDRGERAEHAAVQPVRPRGVVAYLAIVRTSYAGSVGSSARSCRRTAGATGAGSPGRAHEHRHRAPAEPRVRQVDLQPRLRALLAHLLVVQPARDAHHGEPRGAVDLRHAHAPAHRALARATAARPAPC
jgi:hypothetical protein